MSKIRKLTMPNHTIHLVYDHGHWFAYPMRKRKVPKKVQQVMMRHASGVNRQAVESILKQLAG